MTRTRRKLNYSMILLLSVFTEKCSSHTAQVAEGKGRENVESLTHHRRRSGSTPSEKPEVHKPMEPDIVHPQVLRDLEVAKEVAKVV